MNSYSAIFSIRPIHADKIFGGEKTVELRRVRPKRLNEGTIVMVYVSSPQKALQGAFKVAKVVQKPLDELWDLVQGRAHLSKQEFDKYFDGVSKGVAIFISKVWYLQEPIQLSELREQLLDFEPPQSFRYTKTEDIKIPLIHSITSSDCSGKQDSGFFE